MSPRVSRFRCAYWRSFPRPSLYARRVSEFLRGLHRREAQHLLVSIDDEELACVIAAAYSPDACPYDEEQMQQLHQELRRAGLQEMTRRHRGGRRPAWDPYAVWRRAQMDRFGRWLTRATLGEDYTSSDLVTLVEMIDAEERRLDAGIVELSADPRDDVMAALHDCAVRLWDEGENLAPHMLRIDTRQSPTPEPVPAIW